MCGIVGYIGKREAYPILIKGLKRLEYRGYDSQIKISLVAWELPTPVGQPMASLLHVMPIRIIRNPRILLSFITVSLRTMPT